MSYHDHLVDSLREHLPLWLLQQLCFAPNKRSVRQLLIIWACALSNTDNRDTTTGSPSSLGTVNMTLCDSVIIRVCIGITIVQNSSIDLPFWDACITCVYMAFAGVRKLYCTQQKKVSRCYYFSPYFQLFCTIVVYSHTNSYNNAVTQCHVDGAQRA